MTTLNSFSRRRGRPRNNRPQIDTGTPETVMKRLLGITTESLDLCMERGIINHSQHWCGIHLRWLYTLRYGIPNVRSIDLTRSNGHEHISMEYNDSAWRSAREKEYHDAVDALGKGGYKELIINLCIYNKRPIFLSLSPNIGYKFSKIIIENIENLRNGLDILVALWKPYHASEQCKIYDIKLS